MTHEIGVFNIVAGPGKWNFIMAFTNQEPVEFQYSGTVSAMKIRVRASIQSISNFSSFGVSWSFTATAELPEGYRFLEGYYSTQWRNGYFKIVATQ